MNPLQYSNDGLLCVCCVVLWHSITPSFSFSSMRFLYIVYLVLCTNTDPQLLRQIIWCMQVQTTGGHV